MVFYRKYRPQTISDLDTDSVREKLYAVLSTQSVPHAFLFTGPKGTGKTSAARIVAKAINCERKAERVKGKDGKILNASRLTLNASIEPCNKCELCVSITNGTNLDVLEIDGASNRGIDEMRDLREKVKLSPSSAQKKVYIIDEVHMLTTEAFNALLKTLEEPPAHVVFILCTTELHKVPETIVSRCFQIAFSKATEEELTRSLTRIIKEEKISIDEDAIKLITELSGGGFRDGAKILEEIVLSANNEKITKEKVEKLYHSTNIGLYTERVLTLLSQKDSQNALLVIEEMAQNEIDMNFFIVNLMQTLHAIMLSKIGVTKKSSDYTFSLEQITALSEMLSKAHLQTKTAVIAQLPLEMVVVEWGRPVESLLSHGVSDAQRVLNHNSAAHSSSLSESRLKNENEKTTVNPGSAFSSLTHAKASLKIDSKNELFWKELIEKMQHESVSLAGVLRGCSLSGYNNKELIIETKFNFHKERLNDPKAIESMQKVLKSMTGNDLKISVMMN